MTREEIRQTAEAIVQVASTGSLEAQQYAEEHAIALLNLEARKDLLSMWPLGQEPDPHRNLAVCYQWATLIKQIGILDAKQP